MSSGRNWTLSRRSLWTENRGLEHSFALEDFRKEFTEELEALHQKNKRKLN